MTIKNTFKEHSQRITENMATFGSIIIRTENTRTLMRQIIAMKYYKELKNECFEMVDFMIGETDFSKVSDRFNYVLDNDYKTFLTGIGIPDNELSRLTKHIKTCMENRNELAHSHTITGYDVSKGQMDFKSDVISIKMIKQRGKKYRNNFITLHKEQLRELNVFVGMIELTLQYLVRIIFDELVEKTEPEESDINSFKESLNNCNEKKISSYYSIAN